jgi:hypothetical protein
MQRLCILRTFGSGTEAAIVVHCSIVETPIAAEALALARRCMKEIKQ